MADKFARNRREGTGRMADTDVKQRIADWVLAHRDELLEWNRRLVSIPSVNRCTDGDEAAVQQVIADRLRELGCETELFEPTDIPDIEVHPDYLAGRSYANRPNVVGRLRGSGGGRTILFSEHADTVPIGDSPWTVDPFGGEVRDGRQYGLGLFDMKGGMAAAMAALSAVRALGIRLAGDVIIESVVDEEYGGANGTLACRLKGYEADLTIIPEPTNMSICPASQGGGMYRVEYEGASGRQFSGEALSNPVYAGARFVEWFRTYERELAGKRSRSRWYEDGAPPAYIQGLQAGSPVLPLYDRSPASCRFDLWIQCFPGTTEEEQLRELTESYESFAASDELLANWPVRITRLIRFLHGMETKRHETIVPFLEGVAAELIPQGLPVHGAPFACDAFNFDRNSDTSVVIWGPKGGNAHAADEYIDIDAFLELVQLYALVIVRWCGSARALPQQEEE